MESVKRIEIIIETREMREVCRTLEALGVSGYSVIRDVTGRGDRGVQRGDELTGVFKNSLLLTAAPPESVVGIITAIRPIQNAAAASASSPTRSGSFIERPARLTRAIR